MPISADLPALAVASMPRLFRASIRAVVVVVLPPSPRAMQQAAYRR